MCASFLDVLEGDARLAEHGHNIDSTPTISEGHFDMIPLSDYVLGSMWMFIVVPRMQRDGLPHIVAALCSRVATIFTNAVVLHASSHLRLLGSRLSRFLNSGSMLCERRPVV